MLARHFLTSGRFAAEPEELFQCPVTLWDSLKNTVNFTETLIAKMYILSVSFSGTFYGIWNAWHFQFPIYSTISILKKIPYHKKIAL